MHDTAYCPFLFARGRRARARVRRAVREIDRARGVPSQHAAATAEGAAASERGRDFGHILQFRINFYQLYLYNYEFREFGCM